MIEDRTTPADFLAILGDVVQQYAHACAKRAVEEAREPDWHPNAASPGSDATDLLLAALNAFRDVRPLSPVDAGQVLAMLGRELTRYPLTFGVNGRDLSGVVTLHAQSPRDGTIYSIFSSHRPERLEVRAGTGPGMVAIDFPPCRRAGDQWAIDLPFDVRAGGYIFVTMTLAGETARVSAMGYPQGHYFQGGSLTDGGLAALPMMRGGNAGALSDTDEP